MEEPDVVEVEPPAGPRWRARAGRALPGVVAGLLGALLVVHFGTMSLRFLPPTPLAKRWEGFVQGWTDPVFTQNWRLFAPDPVADDRTQRARAQVRTAGGGLVTTDWIQIGNARDEDGVLSNVHLDRYHRIPDSARRELQQAEQDLKEFWDDEDADPSALVRQPRTPDQLVEDYDRAKDRLVRAAVLAVQGRFSGEVVWVQYEFTTTELPDVYGSAPDDPRSTRTDWWSAGDAVAALR